MQMSVTLLSTIIAASLGACFLSSNYFFQKTRSFEIWAMGAKNSIPDHILRQEDYTYNMGGETYIELDPERTKVRSSFGLGPGVRVQGWPSKGGTYILRDCVRLELDFLEVDRFKPSRRSDDQEDEEAHCERMRKLGATWWKIDQALAVAELFGAKEKKYLQDPVIIAGWPANGGVWVLTKPRIEAIRMGTGVIKLAKDMEERCRLIKEFGGAFYEDPEECPDLDLA
ncbi:hypothetical protein K4K58_001804 [Colletotrichum sp. SAR11_239]|nr:hypothetical protein K4K58_001804 [Colletotrichum sp. SAR11_239]